MTTKKDIDILLDVHDEAREHLHAVAVEIAELVLSGQRPDVDTVDRYKIARMSYESTLRDVINCITLVASVEVANG